MLEVTLLSDLSVSVGSEPGSRALKINFLDIVIASQIYLLISKGA